MSLTELLLATQDPTKRQAAEAQIRQAEQASAEQYFVALAEELNNGTKPVIARQLAGLLLKNGLAAKDPIRSQELKVRWGSISENGRNAVKKCTTSALITPELDVGKAAAQVLAKIGVIELPAKQWDGLLPLLLQHVTNTDTKARNIALVTLGYLCEDLVALQDSQDTPVSQEISNPILTAVVQGMRETDLSTVLEACKAFYHAVVLARNNFKNPQERGFIMQIVQQCCTNRQSEDVQVAAFESIVQIATEYYDQLMEHMNTLGPLTWETIRGAPEKVAIPAMEFWSTVCDEELFLKELAEDGQLGDRRPQNLIQQALPFLVPLLVETLTKQASEDDDDTWNLAMAAGTCLTLVAQVVGDNCVDLVLSFVQQNFENADWKFREAAVLAYGSIMDGPTSEKMRPLVQQSYGSLVNRLNDQSVAVRDTIAWTLGRIAMFHHTIVPVRELTPILGQKLADVPRVATNICWVIQTLAEKQCSVADIPPTTPLSEFFTGLVQGLLGVTMRPDAAERNLRMAAYNALSVLITHAGNDCNVHMEAILQEMLGHLNKVHAQRQTVDRECEVQGYICGVLTALTQRLRSAVLPHADRMMEECLKVFQAYQQVKGPEPCLQEEALLLVAALASSVGPNFEKYMPHFAPVLKVGLENYADVQVCLMAIGVVGDLTRALEARFTTYCAGVLQILYGNLQNQNVDRKIKAAIMCTFGDIALAITGDFEKYLAPVVQMLQEASRTTSADGPANDEDWIDYLNSLREGVCEAYTGIIHGLREANKLHLFKEHVNAVLHFVKVITEDTCTSEAVMKAAVAVIGDLVFAFQQELTQHLMGAPFLAKLVEFCSTCTDPNLQRTSLWLQQLLQRFGR
eukprot:TRINITY_DN71288_c0_g1_i1.p1 TRINITY_DN71288_c0_g1~~TRINITY_DN71288_c0_g1_i1.p1  ORF type:complete len:858 (-),score=175.51 TRINITY_DN71288_c0_g1_i1:193-2766(-)